jgi:DNA repair protein RecO (recombination protein O)
MRISLQPAYILHSRPYRDSSQILEVLTAEYGRVSLVARGARRRTRGGGSNSALLQPFTPLLLSFSGRTELKSLTATEGEEATVVVVDCEEDTPTETVYDPSDYDYDHINF